MNKTRLYLLLVFAFLASCVPVSPAASSIDVTLRAEGEDHALSLPAGSTVRQALDAANIDLGELDRVEPPSYSELADGETVRVIRVTEEFEVEQTELPFTSRTLPNEGLAVGDQQLIQNGANGLQEVTYRLLYEDGELVARAQLSVAILTQPVDEIIMIGAQSPFSSVKIGGRLAFISAGNAWVLEGSGSRRAVAITGDLDGRIFSVSPDGAWLLFSRATAGGSEINELWVASLDEGEQNLIDLGAANVVHFADWVPDADYEVAFSTVEPFVNSPGWKANNDLQIVALSDSGTVEEPRVVLSPRQDGFYAWWGTDYAWSPNGDQLAFARPDGVGTVNLDSDSLDVWFTLPAYQTGSDWAWIPGLTWINDESFGYIRYDFDPVSFSLALAGDSGSDELVPNVGMFAEPVAGPDGEQMAFLRAYTPLQSDISTYELMVVTSEGLSASLFPPEGAAGLQPQRVAWSPTAETGPMIAFVYEGNLWVVNVLTGEANQLTGDGLVSAASWR